MDDKRIYNVNVIAQDVLLTPEEVKRRLGQSPIADDGPQPPAPSGGFVGWLKRLFGGGKQAKQAEPRA